MLRWLNIITVKNRKTRYKWFTINFIDWSDKICPWSVDSPWFRYFIGQMKIYNVFSRLKFVNTYTMLNLCPIYYRTSAEYDWRCTLLFIVVHVLYNEYKWSCRRTKVFPHFVVICLSFLAYLVGSLYYIIIFILDSHWAQNSVGMWCITLVIWCINNWNIKSCNYAFKLVNEHQYCRWWKAP